MRSLLECCSFMLARGTLVPNYLRSFSCKGTFVPFYHCPALKIGSFLFIGVTIVPINGSGLNEMNILFLTISSYLCKMVPIKNDSSFLQFVQQKYSSILAIYAFVAI